MGRSEEKATRLGLTSERADLAGLRLPDDSLS